MRKAKVCGHTLVVPDHVADWDAVAEDSPWEKERIESILNTLQRGDVLVDVGAEHGWMSAIFGLHVGGENMILCEPTPEFWPNIRLCWDHNDLAMPLMTWPGLVGDQLSPGGDGAHMVGWPTAAKGHEYGAGGYRYLHDAPPDISQTTLDRLSTFVGEGVIRGVTIDVEGAELSVLRGAHDLLTTSRPHVWVSVHPDLMERDYGTTPSDVFDYMADHRYSARLLRVDHEHHWYFEPC